MPLKQEPQKRKTPELLEGFVFAPCVAVACYNLFPALSPSFVQPKTFTLIVSMAAIVVLLVINRFVSYDMRIVRAGIITSALLMLGSCLAVTSCPWVLKVAGDVCGGDRKSTRLNSSHTDSSRMPSSA